LLTGSELLTKVKESRDASKSELVGKCGYVSSRKDNAERLNFTAFDEALLEAKALSLSSDIAGRDEGGRTLSTVATMQGNGNHLVGKAFTAMFDLRPGDEFEIKLGRKQIKLFPAGDSDEESSTDLACLATTHRHSPSGWYAPRGAALVCCPRRTRSSMPSWPSCVVGGANRCDGPRR
jgi:hypothetical protein